MEGSKPLAMGAVFCIYFAVKGDVVAAVVIAILGVGCAVYAHVRGVK